MIDNELAFAQETSSSAELLPSSGDDSVSTLESGVVDNNSTSAFSDPYSQEVTEVSPISESINYDSINNYFSEATIGSSLANESQQTRNDTGTGIDIDELAGIVDGQATSAEPLYGFTSTDVTIDDLSGTTMTLNTIETPASNIELQANDGTVPSSDAPAAVNGGFFDGSNLDLLNIAVNNDVPVAGQPGETGVGWANSETPRGITERGTLYWDGETNTAGVEVVSDVPELKGTGVISNPDNYWAQGGISMALNEPTIDSPIIRDEQDREENVGLPQQTYDDDLLGIGEDTGESERTALIYDDISNNETISDDGTSETGTDIYLVTTQDEVTLGEFRSAITQTFTTAEDGIFLDGGGSTQIKTPDFSDEGSDTPGRTIPQIVALESIDNQA